MTRATVLQEVRQMRVEKTLRAAITAGIDGGGDVRDAGGDGADILPLAWAHDVEGRQDRRLGHASARAEHP